MFKVLCDDVLKGTNRRRIMLYDEHTGDAIMTDGIMYETELEALEREALEFLISEESDDEGD